MTRVAVIGGGLAGCEATLQIARSGIAVDLYEMRPHKTSPAHRSDALAELVCSNSLKSDNQESAAGLLKEEITLLGSRLIRIARSCAVEAGTALAVDRREFSRRVTQAIESEHGVTLRREEYVFTGVGDYDGIVIAAGPLASDALIESLTTLIGERLSFYDAVSPIIDAESVDFNTAFFGSRYGKGSGHDYVNCPFTEEEYHQFHQQLIEGERVIARDFDQRELFSACQPIEEVARTGQDALRFGALKPVGIEVPATGRRAYALAQLRAEDRGRQSYNLVGFQTNLTWSEQRRIFRLVPGLEHADFLRYGVMHRNTFIDSPRLCNADFSLKGQEHVWFCGQITGTEGYVEAIASGLFVSRNVIACLTGTEPLVLPPTTVSGALFRYATDPETQRYQPMHVNFGLVAPLEQKVRSRRERNRAYAERALR